MLSRYRFIAVPPRSPPAPRRRRTPYTNDIGPDRHPMGPAVAVEERRSTLRRTHVSSMFSPFRALRGPTIRAMLARMAVVAVALVVVLAAVRIVGQRVSSSRYHQAAVTEVARIQPASRLLTDMLNAQTAVQGYITTIDPFRLL